MAISGTLELSLCLPIFVNWAAHVNPETSRVSVVLSGLDGRKGMVWYGSRTVQDAGKKHAASRSPAKHGDKRKKADAGASAFGVKWWSAAFRYCP
ncbi:hypothetical protein Pla22_24410 [Rubripirellula amarantea]|uniref:Uncharacterized protein n=1 Tax=Rubripirellula amarantea TaxID=2527999 RepID=A0A5C5WVN6_9BACT|nr:hypothetical protein Pla22_24410 [Rubripirellula amarantea]